MEWSWQWYGVGKENSIPEVRRHLLAVDPVQDGALKVPIGGIEDVLIVAHIIRNSLISTDGNPGVWIRWVGLKVMLPVVAVHLESQEGDPGVIKLEEG